MWIVHMVHICLGDVLYLLLLGWHDCAWHQATGVWIKDGPDELWHIDRVPPDGHQQGGVSAGHDAPGSPTPSLRQELLLQSWRVLQRILLGRLRWLWLKSIWAHPLKANQKIQIKKKNRKGKHAHNCCSRYCLRSWHDELVMARSSWLC